MDMQIFPDPIAEPLLIPSNFGSGIPTLNRIIAVRRMQRLSIIGAGRGDLYLDRGHEDLEEITFELEISGC